MKRETKSREKLSAGRWANYTYNLKRVAGISSPFGRYGALSGPLLCRRFHPANILLDEICSGVIGGSRIKWKPFEHYKMVQEDEFLLASCHDITYSSSNPSDWREGYRALYPVSTWPVRVGSLTAGIYYAPSGLPSWRTSSPDDIGFTPLPSNLFALQQNALKAIMPRIKAEFSVINAVHELKDFKRLALTAKSALQRVAALGLGKVLLSTAKNVGKSLRNPSLAGMSKLAAGTYLQWKFAVQPLISDIAATWRAVSNTEKRLRKLLDNAEKVRIGHFSVSWPEYSDQTLTSTKGTFTWPTTAFPPGMSDNPKTCLNVQHVRHIEYEPSKFHVEIEYSYYFLDLQIAHSRLLAYLDAFGINLNPAIIWNAIPYTFIIDWVFGVSRFLDSMSAGFMDPVVFIHQSLWSITRERRITGIVRHHALGGIPGGTQEFALPVCVETSYRRELYNPTKALLLTASGLTPTELSLGAALVVARRARNKKRR